jgi:hypothetical protein
MTREAYQRVWQHARDRRGTRKLLLLALAEYADPIGVCWPSIPTIAQLVSEDDDYTGKLLKQAEEDGDILRHAGRGRGNTTNDLLASIKQSKAGGAAPFGGSTAEPVRDDSWYRERLEEVAQSAISASASSVRRSRAVIVSVSASGGSISLSDVIVLGNVRASMGSVSGTIYFPPGKGASADMGSMGATTYNRTWKQLYQLAVKWGLIEETPAPAGNGGKYNVTVIGSTGVTIGDHQ